MNDHLRTLAFLLLLNLVLPRISYSQDDTVAKPVIPFYKNGIKGKPTFLPFVGIGIYVGISLGYEHYFSKRHGLELCSFYYFNTDEMGAQFHTIGVIPGFKFFSVTDNKRTNNWWIGPYLLYLQNIQTLSDQGKGWGRRYYYGIGVSGGKKMYLSRNHRWFMDLGFGFSVNAFLNESIFSETEWEDKFVNTELLPRPIFLFGWKF
jgi:hypothetical protein